MAYVEAVQNLYSYTESELSSHQVDVPNADGRDWAQFEIVIVGKYVGPVAEPDGIANGARGRIDIQSDVVIQTTQIEATDTFVVDAEVFFRPGTGAVPGFIVDTGVTGDIAYGKIVESSGVPAAETWIRVRPYPFSPERALVV